MNSVDGLVRVEQLPLAFRLLGQPSADSLRLMRFVFACYVNPMTHPEGESCVRRVSSIRSTDQQIGLELSRKQRTCDVLFIYILYMCVLCIMLSKAS